MTRIRCAVTAAVVVIILVPMYLGAQSAAVRTLPITGTVADQIGERSVGVHVVLVRHSTRQGHAGEAVEILSQGDTDARGEFALGNVPVRAELEFPLETSVRLEYVVTRNRVELPVENIDFTAARTNAVVTSVAAEIRLR